MHLKIRLVLCVITAVYLALIMVSAGCGSTNSNSTYVQIVPDGGSAPSLDEMNAVLQAEFERLGIEPSKVAATVPKGSANAVFDLAAELIDPDGAGGDPPTGIALAWTERLIGDYNQDGMVTQNDLTPIGQNYAFDTSLPQIGYENPELHGGFEQWPGGDPDDPAEGGGAHNWRLARIDGNGDGFILMYDIPAIAQHWQEQLSGYRLYRKAPGEVEFSLAEMVTTAVRDGLRPVRYFHSEAVLAEGEYAFYVAPFDETTNLQGPPSGVLTIDTTSGMVNQSPVAKLTVTPDFAGAPAVITMDASGSYDPDGTVAGYIWDFDGDGTDDWLTGDPVPEQSSSGRVTNITPVSDGVVEVTYADGSSNWKYPQVAAWDDQDARSLYTLAKLGISGWHELELMESTSSYLIDCIPNCVEVDPATGRYVIGSSRTDVEITGGATYGPYLHWQQADGTWSREKISVPSFNPPDSIGSSVVDIVWDEYNRPLVLASSGNSSLRIIWSAQQRGDGTWDLRECFQTEMPEHLKEIAINPAKTHHEPGRFACMISECLTDKPHIAGLPGYHTRRHILSYDNGSWTTEFTGIDSADTYSMMCQILGTGFDDLTIFHSVREDTPGGPWWSHWEEGVGPGTPERMDGGILNMTSPNAYCLEAARLADGTVVTTWDDTTNTLDRQFWMLSTGESSSTKYDISELSSRTGFDILYIKGLYANSRGAGLFSYHSNSAHTYPMSYLEHRRFENGEWLVETASLPKSIQTNCGSWIDSAQNNDGEPVALVSQHNAPETSDINKTYDILERLDPRV